MEPGTEQPLPAAAGLTDDSIEQLRAVISAFEAAVSAQVAAGQRLGDLVRDQIADGQTETLLSLERHAGALGRRAVQVEAAAERVRLEMRESESALATAVTDASKRMATLFASIDQRADAAAARLEASAQSAEQLLSASTESANRLLATSTGLMQARLAAAERALVQSAAQVEDALQNRIVGELARLEPFMHRMTAQLTDQVGERMQQAAADLDERGTSLVDRARLELLERLRSERQDWMQMLSQGRDQAQVVGARTVDQLSDASARLIDGLAQAAEALEGDLRSEREQARAVADAFLVAAETLLTRGERIDQRRQRKIEDRVEVLFQRTDTAVGGTVDRLAMTLQQLQERDVAQERERAAEFVRVLEDLMSRIGSGRSLRKLVTRAIEGERRDRRAAPAEQLAVESEVELATEVAPVVAQEAEAAESAAAPDPPRRARKTAPASEKAPAVKKAPRKRAAPSKPSTAAGPASSASSEGTT